jgi:hypothetical protein
MNIMRTLILTIFLTLGIASVEAADTAEQKKGCELVSCPSENGEWALSLPNPLSCSSFCHCDWGTAYYKTCPNGSYFNTEKQVCEAAQNVECPTPSP